METRVQHQSERRAMRTRKLRNAWSAFTRNHARPARDVNGCGSFCSACRKAACALFLAVAPPLRRRCADEPALRPLPLYA